MTRSSFLDIKARRVLVSVAAQLDEGRLQERFNKPIMASTVSFQGNSDIFSNSNNILSFIGAFMRHVYLHGIKPAIHLSRNHAAAMGLEYINNAEGFDNAYLNILNDSEQGMEQIVQTLTGMIIDRQREAYISGVLSRSIDPWNWELNYKLTEILLKELKPHFPSHLQDLSAGMFVSNLNELIVTKCKQNTAIQNMLNHGN